MVDTESVNTATMIESKRFKEKAVPPLPLKIGVYVSLATWIGGLPRVSCQTMHSYGLDSMPWAISTPGILCRPCRAWQTCFAVRRTFLLPPDNSDKFCKPLFSWFPPLKVMVKFFITLFLTRKRELFAREPSSFLTRHYLWGVTSPNSTKTRNIRNHPPDPA